jgi:hypothetical protein
VTLTDAQLDTISAGAFNNVLTPGTNHVKEHEGSATTVTAIDPNDPSTGILGVTTPGTQLVRPFGGEIHDTTVTPP